MPYVPVQKDLNTVKTKVAFNLTKRQLICFSLAAAIGVPIYFLTRGILGTTGAVFLLLAAALPFLWFCCTAQPIAIHYWYQYRSIALTHWAVGAYVTMTFWQGNQAKELQK